VGLKADMEAVEKRNVPHPRIPIVQLVASHHTDRATPALLYMSRFVKVSHE